MKIIRGLLLVCWLVGLAMAAATSVGNATAPSVFGKGPLPTKITNLSKGTGTKPPVSAVIVAPQDATTKSYPLIVFQVIAWHESRHYICESCRPDPFLES